MPIEKIPADAWQSLRATLREQMAAPAFLLTQLREMIDPATPPSQRETSATIFLSDHMEEAKQALLELYQKKELPPLSPEATTCAMTMLLTIVDFVDTLIVEQHNGAYTLFPFPGERAEVLVWLFSEWWPSVGIRVAARKYSELAPMAGVSNRYNPSAS
ncbi:MAG TPA: hypothetical protein VGM54_20460 [Chthoniobacter sp.]|jgi:hypothetical protein